MKKIEIYFDQECVFDVVVENKHADQLVFDEMLGLIAQLTMPNNRPLLCCLKTKDEHDAYRKMIEQSINNQ